MTIGRPIYTIYTDGGCDPNPGRGGWGAVIIDSNNQVREQYRIALMFDVSVEDLL